MSSAAASAQAKLILNFQLIPKPDSFGGFLYNSFRCPFGWKVWALLKAILSGFLIWLLHFPFKLVYLGIAIWNLKSTPKDHPPQAAQTFNYSRPQKILNNPWLVLLVVSFTIPLDVLFVEKLELYWRQSFLGVWFGCCTFLWKLLIWALAFVIWK